MVTKFCFLFITTITLLMLLVCNQRDSYCSSDNGDILTEFLPYNLIISYSSSTSDQF